MSFWTYESAIAFVYTAVFDFFFPLTSYFERHCISFAVQCKISYLWNSFKKRSKKEIFWMWNLRVLAILSCLSKKLRTQNKGRKGRKISLSSRHRVSRVVWMAVSIQLAPCFMAITAHHPSLVYSLLITADSTSCEFYLCLWLWCTVKA